MDSSLFAYATLLTQDHYLPGVVVLNRSLREVRSKYPLVVMTAPGLSASTLQIIQNENIKTRPIELLSLLSEQVKPNINVFDARFADTWSKLRVFELEEYQRVVMLDSDMLVRQNIDDLFDLDLPNDWIAAAHVCACNPRQLAHYPADWKPANCAHSSVRHPEGITNPPVIKADSPRPYTQLNSGVVVLHPSRSLAEKIVKFLYTSPLAVGWTFPDQDLLAAYFAGRWKVLPWCYNALQPMVLIHASLWRDEEARCIHYIGPIKPWNGRVAFNPAYQVTNDWWWTSYDALERDLGETRPADRDFIAQYVVT